MSGFLKQILKDCLNPAPHKLLTKMANALEDMDDGGKQRFLESNIWKIKDAMLKTGLYQSDDINSSENALSTHDGALEYLDWHQTLLATLHDDDDAPLDTSRLSGAAEYFMVETKADVKSAFKTLFDLHPETALSNLPPAALFREEILEAMATVVKDDYPQLYFDCYDAIDFKGDQSQNVRTLTQNLIHLTDAALSNLLEKDPDLLLFPSTQFINSSTMEKGYLFYLPHDINRQNFIADNIDKITKVFREIAPNADDAYLDDFKTIYSVFSDENRPSQLETLKKLLISERVKICFRIAASDNRHPLTQKVKALNLENSDLVHIQPIYETDQGTNHVCELLCLTHPLALTDGKEDGEKLGNLWMLRKSDEILVAAFSKADISGYLKIQTQYPPNELPTVQQWDEFSPDQITPALS